MAAPEDKAYGCEHYKRRCLLKAPCCGEFWPCRVCHDAVKNEGQRDPKKKCVLDRHKVVTVRCTGCSTEQPAQQLCRSCGITMGAYYCGVCKLYDDVDKGQFHCDGCGICRVGGKSNFFHCDKCGSCFASSGRTLHRCTDGLLKQDCPVCLEFLHTSREPATTLPCGHAMHERCRDEFLQSGNYKCPTCSRAMVNMRPHWQQMDVECALTPMPAAYAGTWVRVLCNDCNAESDTPWHVVGLKCRAMRPAPKPTRAASATAAVATAATEGEGDTAAVAQAAPALAASSGSGGMGVALDSGAEAAASHLGGFSAVAAAAAHGGGASTVNAPLDRSSAPESSSDSSAAATTTAPEGGGAPWKGWCGSYNTRKLGNALQPHDSAEQRASDRTLQSRWVAAVLGPLGAAALASAAFVAGGEEEEDEEEEDDEEEEEDDEEEEEDGEEEEEEEEDEEDEVHDQSSGSGAVNGNGGGPAPAAASGSDGPV